MSKLYFYLTFFLWISSISYAQEEFSLYSQFNGRYDFTFIGNTMNYVENGAGVPCIIQTSSSATLQLQSNDYIEKAYLYWSGSGNGDLEIEFNGQFIEAQRHFNITHSNLVFFVAFADVTEQIQSTGNGIYTLSELDISAIISQYCPNATNYAGWSLVVVYKNDELPLNQLNIYDGFMKVPDELTITLDNLNVMDNEGAKIGFVAWEGDSGIAVNETLRINGNIMSNPPLNPANNAFNGTNSITGSSSLYNMDLDIYEIHNNINIGDTTAVVQLTSGQDLVMISTVVTKLNNQLPDAEITVNQIQTSCDSQIIDIYYTVYNNGTDVLPSVTPLSVYVNGSFDTVVYTQNQIGVDEFENGSVTVTLSEEFTEDLEIYMVADDLGAGNGIVIELNENNNTSNIIYVQPLSSPEFNQLEDITGCNIGNNRAIFDFSQYEYLVKQNDEHIVSFYNSSEDAHSFTNTISNIFSYEGNVSPKEIFVRIDDEYCYSVTSFFLYIRNCPPVIYNGISANDDGYNDEFLIEGLYDIFPDFEIFVYSRWGQLVWKGNNYTPMWKGTITERNTVISQNAPEGTYFYILNLNDKDYPESLQGFLYLTR